MRIGAFLIVLAASSVAAYAETPSSADQSKVEAALKADGYTRWKSIVLDNGTWEVDDAINAAGKQFDLRIDANSLNITSQIEE